MPEKLTTISLVYVGSMSAITFDTPSLTMKKDEACEVPKALADELLKNRSSEFKKSTLTKATTTTKKEVT